ncbi:hypothetical protein A7Q09_04070 [Methylacidiphilum sp. Yel]|uniref:hypothetical protein n=1 Tax=Methylacidiphilum sp. Yel TaxID=1847730 RepID=UPI001068F867|nr:hypothetical protein [Methylacidiphilum sp. Yel]TFE70239.1 hypothetical protein A7Q09_04070 [Methylacidiphilum sp. Yel]
MKNVIFLLFLFFLVHNSLSGKETPLLLPNITPRLAKFLESLPLNAQNEITTSFKETLSYDLIGDKKVEAEPSKRIIEIDEATEAGHGVLVFEVTQSGSRFLFLNDLPYKIPLPNLSQAEQLTIALIFAEHEKAIFVDRNWGRMWFDPPSAMTDIQKAAYKKLGLIQD